ncbi:MAG: hypothetical protein WKF37_10435 [Bryobacteraceae bacterium]
MSWTSAFPILSDEMVWEYESEASPAEKAELGDWFSIKKIFNPKAGGHLLSFSLFWKNPRQTDPDLPKLSRQILKKAKKEGLVTRFEPWTHYVEPLLEGLRQIREKDQTITPRVYLARDLEFLIDDLVDFGCEVYLMKSSSVRHNPGAMWRFLALEEKRRLVTICDSDRAPMVGPDLQRTVEMSKAGLGMWRVPVWGDLHHDGSVCYRPMFGGQFGGCLGLPMCQLNESLRLAQSAWHSAPNV